MIKDLLLWKKKNQLCVVDFFVGLHKVWTVPLFPFQSQSAIMLTQRIPRNHTSVFAPSVAMFTFTQAQRQGSR